MKEITPKAMIIGIGAFMTFAYAAYKFHEKINTKIDKSDISYASQKLKYLPNLIFKQEIEAPKIIIDIQTPSTAGTIRWYLYQTLATIIENSSNAVNAIRLCVPGSYIEPGQSPNKITGDWIGGLKTAKEELNTDKNYFSGITFIAGHMPFGLHNYLHEGHGAKYVGMAIDPVKQRISDTNLAFQRGYIEEKDALDYLLNGGKDNLQTLLFAGEPHTGVCTEEIFNIAKKNIEDHFLLVGVTGDGMEMETETNLFLQVIASIMCQKPIAVTKAQVSGNKIIKEISLELKEQLLKKNEFDVRLYKFIEDRWQKWKVQHIDFAATNAQPPTSEKILCITEKFSITRVPEHMSITEIDEFNKNKNDNDIVLTRQEYVESNKFKSI